MEKELEVQSIALPEGIDLKMACSLWSLLLSCNAAIIQCIENKVLIEELAGLQCDIENFLEYAGLIDSEFDLDLLII